jgi:hypothetical protein
MGTLDPPMFALIRRSPKALGQLDEETAALQVHLEHDILDRWNEELAPVGMGSFHDIDLVRAGKDDLCHRAQVLARRGPYVQPNDLVFKVHILRQRDRLFPRDLDQMVTKRFSGRPIFAPGDPKQDSLVMETIAQQGPRLGFFSFPPHIDPLEKAKAVRVVGQDLDTQLASNSMGTQHSANRQERGLRSAPLAP